MTRQEIESLPSDELTALLTVKVMGMQPIEGSLSGYIWDDPRGERKAAFCPTRNRDDLAELLRAVPKKRRVMLSVELHDEFEEVESDEMWSFWLLTCDPLLICRAVAVAMCGGDA